MLVKPTNKCRRKDIIRKSSFSNHHKDNCLGQKSSINAKISGQKLKIGYERSLQVSPHKTLSNYKMQNNKFTMEKIDIHPFNQAVKVNIASNGTN